MIWWKWTCLTGNYASKLSDLHVAQIRLSRGMKLSIFVERTGTTFRSTVPSLGRSLSLYWKFAKYGACLPSTDGLNVYSLGLLLGPAIPDVLQTVGIKCRYKNCRDKVDVAEDHIFRHSKWWEHPYHGKHSSFGFDFLIFFIGRTYAWAVLGIMSHFLELVESFALRQFLGQFPSICKK